MQVQLETLSGLERRMSIALPMAAIDAQVAERLKRVARTAKIQGFRPGKAPAKIVEMNYGAQVREEVLGEQVQQGFYKAAVEQKLRAALEGQHIQVVNVSGGQSLLELRGPNVRDVLMKSTSYDVHPNNFPVGKAVGTVFAKSQLVIRHTAEDTWELLIRRSFSDYWWLWLQDASAEYGLSVQA